MDGGVRMVAETENACDPRGAGGRREAGEMRVVLIEHGGAMGRHAVEDLGLGIGDRLDRREKAEMDGLDGSDHGHVGGCETR